MLFSVIVPAYNNEAFLPQTLDSLLGQTMPDFEVVIVNDGSVDNTQAVIDAYRTKDARIRCLTQANAGVSAARNNGLLAARGDWVAFLDADDYYAPDTLAAFWSAAQSANADVLLGRLYMVENGKAVRFHEAADLLAREPDVQTFDKRLLWNFLVNNKCYRRAFLLEHGVQFPATGFSEEGAFFMDAVYSGAVIKGAPQCVVYYRRHTAEEGLSVSQTASERNLQSLDGSMRHIYASAEEALKRAGKTDSDYLQEILYKQLHILVSQFYRELWHMTDGAFALCVSQTEALLQKLTPARRDAICKANSDLDLRRLRKTKADAAAHPRVSVTVKKRCAEEAAASLFAQTCPLFELLLSEKAASDLPAELVACPNVKTGHGHTAKGDVKLRFAALPVLDPGLLQRMQRLPVKTAFAAKLLNLLLKRRHGE